MFRYLLIASCVIFPVVCTAQTGQPDSSATAIYFFKKISTTIGEQTKLGDDAKKEIAVILIRMIEEMKGIRKNNPDKLEGARFATEVREKMFIQIKTRFGANVLRTVKQILSPVCKQKPWPCPRCQNLQKRVGRIVP